MIENMRKYTGLMVVVLVLLAAGLVITMKPGGSGGGAGSDFMQVNGVALDRNDYAKEGKNTLQMIRRSDYQLLDFAGTLSGANAFAILQGQYDEQAVLNFVTNRILLKQAAEKLGLYSSPEVAEQYILDNMFLGQDGKHDAKLYSSYIESIAGLGIKEKDFQKLVAEYIVFTKARDLIGGGLTANKAETVLEDKLQRQEIGMSTVTFNLADYSKDIAPSDDEIKAYWETHKDKYLTERMVKVTYVLTLVDSSDKPQAPTPAADASPEDTTKLNLEYQDKLAEWSKQRKQHTNKLAALFDDFLLEVEDSKAVDFDKAAAAAKETAGEDLQVVTTDAFTKDQIPAALKALEIKNGKNIEDIIFGMKMSKDIAFNVDTFSVQPDGHIAIRLDEEIPAKTKSFEDAKELAKADLIAKLATEAMTKAAEAAKTELATAIGAGTAFADAAQAKGLTATEIAPFAAAAAPSTPANAADLFRVAQATAPKTIATELATSADSATIIYVASRTLTVEGDEALKETELLEKTANQLKYVTFNAWLNNLKEGAELKLPLVR